MRVHIAAYDPSHLDAIVELSLRAWAPVFDSLRKAMDPEVFDAQHPDWRKSQAAAVTSACEDASCSVWVAIENERVAGFVALKLHEPDKIGEIYMIAVDPDFQRKGIAAALTSHSLSWLKEAGMTTAMVETGGDPGHGPARATYEASGFRALPLARYFKKL